MKWTTIIYIYAAVVILGVLLAPLYGAKVIDPRNMRKIRKYCEDCGLTDISIKPYPNHYGVRFKKDGNKKYCKCFVVKGEIQWKGSSPEEC